ncbi:MAG: hydrogenase accessory protein HypB [Firmicutes bacterium]|nr:hydrogenase accessory protein HypB [Bacillota bacterium]
MEVQVMANILDKNDKLAAEVNALFSVHGIFCLNLLGSPGSGKTSLLEHTIISLKEDIQLAVIEGDLFTDKDAERIARKGAPVIQINTGGGCHLDAAMVKTVISKLDLTTLDLVIIENVGNLVCPAEFNIGEDVKVTVLSVTEGEDKPMKYPLVFKAAGAVVINKIDLIPYTSFDMNAVKEDIESLNPQVSLIEVSCRTGDGLEGWYDWLKDQIVRKKARC